jgi:two-component system phosphate regulon response regulator PhoB
LTQELLVINMTQHGFCAIQALDAASAMTFISDALPDLILLDWMLPDMSGIELTRRLRGEQRTRNIPIIMLTGRNEERDKVLGLESGVDDYITKPFSPRELMARIRALLRRKAPLLREALYAGGLELSASTQRVRANGEIIDLGPTEFNILHFFMAHPERIFSRSQLLNQLWPNNVTIEERSVDVYIRRLRQALEPSGFDGLLQTVRGTGYLFTSK